MDNSQPQPAFDFKANIGKTILFSLKPPMSPQGIEEMTIRKVSPKGIVALWNGLSSSPPLWLDPAVIEVKDILE